MEKVNIFKSELMTSFSKWKSFRKTDLRDFYKHQINELTENHFRRILYSLEKRNIIKKIDTGMYVLEVSQTPLPLKNKFTPMFSSEIFALNTSLKKAFPYMEYLIWETKILHEFMIHQPGQNQIILEIEKEVEESVFNFLNTKNRYEGKVSLDSDREIIERYALRNSNGIFISTLLIQAPVQRVKTISCPKIEKILVDIFADNETFFIFQGQELINIYETIFTNYQVGQKAFFRYAQRRKVHHKIRTFITQKTDIQLYQYGETKP